VIVLLFGPPGCGKGTQAAFIAKRFEIPAISTGEVLRGECKAGTELGKAASTIMAAGGLVGDDLINPMVANRIAQPDCARGFLLDGYPRTLPQAEYLALLLQQRRLRQPVAIHLDVAAGAIVARITSRRQCPSCSRIYNVLSQPPRTDGVCDDDGTALIRRQDDTEEVVVRRLKAYDEATGPVIRFYNHASHRIDGARSVEEIWRDVESLLLPAFSAVAK
jgi:adenylate kinase